MMMVTIHRHSPEFDFRQVFSKDCHADWRKLALAKEFCFARKGSHFSFGKNIKTLQYIRVLFFKKICVCLVLGLVEIFWCKRISFSYTRKQDLNTSQQDNFLLGFCVAKSNPRDKTFFNHHPARYKKLSNTTNI